MESAFEHFCLFGLLGSAKPVPKICYRLESSFKQRKCRFSYSTNSDSGLAASQRTQGFQAIAAQESRSLLGSKQALHLLLLGFTPHSMRQ